MTKIQIVKATYCRNPIVGNCGKHYSDRKVRLVVNFKMKSTTYYEEQ